MCKVFLQNQNQKIFNEKLANRNYNIKHRQQNKIRICTVSSCTNYKLFKLQSFSLNMS